DVAEDHNQGTRRKPARYGDKGARRSPIGMSLDSLLIGKLHDAETRYENLNAELADPEVISDNKRYQKTAKAHSDLGEIVARYQEYKEIEKGLNETRSMLREAG